MKTNNIDLSLNEVDPKTKFTALHYAALQGHKSVVEALLSWGAIVDPQDHGGATPLYAACQEGHLACVLALLKAVIGRWVGRIGFLAEPHQPTLPEAPDLDTVDASADDLLRVAVVV